MANKRVSAVIIFSFILILLFLSAIVFFSVSPLTPLVVSRLTVVQKTVANCSISYSRGWNLIGLSCQPKNNSPKSLFYEKILNVSNTTNETTFNIKRNKLISIHSYDSNDLNDPWKAYNPDLPAWVVQDLKVTNRRNGYWIHSSADFISDFKGSHVSPTYINLYPGWNLVGYPALNSTASDIVFNSIYNEMNYVYYYNSSSQEWLSFSYLNGLENSTLKEIKRHYGMWINMKEAGVWHVE